MSAGFGQSAERAQRLVQLTSALGLGTPRTLAELRDRYRLYGGSEAAMRRQFLRDKEDLAEGGVTVETVDIGDGPAYWIRERPTAVTLEGPELDALAVLSASVADPSTGAALAALAGGSGQFPADQGGGRVSLDRVDVPVGVTKALSERLQLVLDYRDAKGQTSQRTVEPWDLVHRRGLTYLVCWDVEKQGERNLRLDRFIGAPSPGGPATAPRPSTPSGPVYPTDRHDFEVTAPVDARIDLAEMGGSVVGRDDDRLMGTFDGYRSEPVLGWALRHDAVITTPDEFAREHQSRLQLLLDRHASVPDHVERPKASKARAKTLSVERMRRLMVLPTYLGEMPGVTRAELAQALGCTVEELDVELALLDSVELPGHGPVGEVSEDRGQLLYVRHLHDPRVHLSVGDAIRLLMLVEVVAPLLEEHSDGLTSLREKLRSVAPTSVSVELAGSRHPDIGLLRDAISRREVVRFEYRGRKDRQWNDRQVAPDQFRVANGAVYVAGTDVVSGEARQFRLDRMGPVEVSGQVPLAAAEGESPRYVATEPEVEVLLRLNSASSWLLTHLTPSAVRHEDDGTIVAVVATDAVEWMASHVMAAGGQAEVLAPPKVRAHIAGRAQAVLDVVSATA